MLPTTLVLLASSALDPEANTQWLADNLKAEGVVQLPSLLQYKVINSGPTDGVHPGPADSCTCHYEGSLIDGTVFDSSRKRGKPATFAPNRVIKGWTEALQMMRPGDRWIIYVPAVLGYGARGAGGKIPGGATLIFDLELLSVDSAPPGMFAGTILAPLDFELLPPFKIWHSVVAVVLFLGWMSLKGGDGQRVAASHILVKDEAMCNELKAQLASGKATFAGLAKQHSTCPSGKSGGALGTFGPGQMVPAFDKVCWSAPIGEVQGPVQTQFGFHLILVTERSGTEEAKTK